MKKNKLFSIIAGVCLACSVNISYAQTDNSLSALPAEAQQEVQNVSQMVQSSPDKVADALKSLLKKYKKDDKATVAIGHYFLAQKQYEQAIACAQAAYGRDNKCLPAIMLEGDANYDMKKYGEAMQKYEEAIYVAPDVKDAYFKKVSVYKYINPQLALETMQTIKEKYPNDPAIDKTMASIYYHLNDTAKAIASYRAYFKSAANGGDLDAKEEYAIVLFLNKDYQGSLDQVNKVLAEDPKEISLNRMKFYDLVELKNYNEAKAAATNFFSLYNDTLYNFSDYKYSGKLNMELKDYAKAMSDYEKASNLAKDKPELLKEYSDACERAGEYDKAADVYQQYIDKAAPGSLSEMFSKGKIYYSAANSVTDAAKLDVKKHYIAEGDSLFAKVSAQSESYMGPFWRARINSTLDPENPNEAAKEAYAEALKRLESKDASYNTERKECLRYMAFYSLKKDDYASTRAYVEKVLAIDPQDALGNQIKQALSQLKK